jgi:hypothetical protein
LALLEQESQDAHDAYAQIFTDNQILRSQLEVCQQELSKVKEELESSKKHSPSVGDEILSVVADKSALEEELRKTKIELEQTKQDSARAYSQGAEEAEIPAIRGFLNSPVFDPLVRMRIGEFLQTIFYKGVQQLILAKRIPDKMEEYLPYMNPFKNVEGKDYKPSSLPAKVDWQNHRFASLVAEFGVPMPNPDILEQSSSDPASVLGGNGDKSTSRNDVSLDQTVPSNDRSEGEGGQNAES